MAKCDRAAVNVNLLAVPAEALIDRASLCRENLNGFDQVEIVRAPAGEFNAFCDAGIGPEPIIAGSTPTDA